jgi:hypothetical protein
VLQFRLGELKWQSLPGPIITEDEASTVLADSAEKQLSAAFRFRMSLHNKMYSSSTAWHVLQNFTLAPCTLLMERVSIPLLTN